MTIRVINATFESSHVSEFQTLDDAFHAAVAAGVEIAAAEIKAGARCTILEVAVDLPDQPHAARGAVAVSIARFIDERVSRGSATGDSAQ